MDVGTIITIRNALNYRHLPATRVYDTNWWLFATSFDDREDALIKEDPNGGMGLADTALQLKESIKGKYFEYMEFQNGENVTPQERLRKLSTFIRSDKDYEAGGNERAWEQLADKWLPPPEVAVGTVRRHIDLVNARRSRKRVYDLYTELTNIDVGSLVDAFANVPIRALEAGDVEYNAPEGEETSALMPLGVFGETRVHRRVAERYGRMDHVADTDNYTLMRMVSGKGVVVFNMFDYGARDIVYRKGLTVPVPQVRIYGIDYTTVKTATDTLGVAFVTISEFDASLRQELEVRDDDGRRELLEALFDVIWAYEAEFVHGQLTLDNILVKRVDGKDTFMLMHFEFATKRSPKDDNEPTFKADFGTMWLTGYGRRGDTTSLVIQLFSEYERTTDVGKFLFGFINQHIHDNDMEKACRIRMSMGGAHVEVQYTAFAADNVPLTKTRVTIHWYEPGKMKRKITAMELDSNIVKITHQFATLIVDATEFVSRSIVLDKFLGRGSFGSVYSIKDAPGVVVKVTDASESEVELQKQAAALGFAPAIHHYFKAKILRIEGKPRRLVSTTEIALIAMESMETTIENFITNAENGVEAIVAVTQATFNIVEQFAKAGFMHHDLKTDNIMMKHNDHGGVVVRIIDFGKAWYAGKDGKTPYGFYKPPQILSLAGNLLPQRLVPWFSTEHNRVGWMHPMSPRNTSNIYDMMCLFTRMCTHIRSMRRDFDPEDMNVPNRLWSFLSTVVVDKLKRMMFLPETTDIPSISWIDAPLVVALVYKEYARIDHPTDSVRTWDVSTSGITLHR